MSLFHDKIYSYLRRKMAQNSNAVQKRPTKRAADWWESARLTVSFLASIFSAPKQSPRPPQRHNAHWASPRTQTVEQKR